MVVKIKYILLSFDLEEFDLPREHNANIESNEMFKVSYKGCEKILDILKKYRISGTFFVSAKFAEKYPKLIKEISKKHEIGLHCYEHRDKDLNKLKEAKKIIENIINKKIKGFRAPRFQIPDYNILNKLGLEYDSSSHPTYIPGHYNHLFDNRNMSIKGGLKIIPVSVSPLFRLPLFWIAFRNFPLMYSKIITKSCFINGDYVCLVFHPWEFVNIKNYKIPFLVKRNTGEKFELKLNKYIEWGLKNKYIFISLSNYLSKSL